MLTHKNAIRIFILLIVILIVLRITLGVSYYWSLFIYFVFLVITAIGSFHIRWNYFIKSLHRSENDSLQEVAITFDDGPHEIFTNKALSILEKHDVKATFFCIGKNIEKYPEILKNIDSNGHEIGNHSYVHANNYGFLSTKLLKADIAKNNELIDSILEKKPLLFRPPFGVTNPRIAKAIISNKMTSIGWSVRSLDTKATSAKEVLDRILPKIKNGDIILLHDTSELSMEVLEQLLLFLAESKIKSVPISKLLSIEVYEN